MHLEGSTRCVSLHFSQVQQHEAKSVTTRRWRAAHGLEQLDRISASRAATVSFVMFSSGSRSLWPSSGAPEREVKVKAHRL